VSITGKTRFVTVKKGNSMNNLKIKLGLKGVKTNLLLSQALSGHTDFGKKSLSWFNSFKT
jgi:hypothetical protein